LRLNTKLAAERDLAASHNKKYRVQMNALRSALDTDGFSSDEATAKLKKQILDLQSLIDEANAERDAYRDRVNENETALRESEAAMALLHKYAENEHQMRAQQRRQKIMFYDVDIEQLQEEREAHAAMVEQQRQHLEVAMDQNKALRARCGALDQQIMC
jgi:DNA repair exonuclease SbcCD ATPase subunit